MNAARRRSTRRRPEWVQQLESRRLLANLGELGIYLVDHSTRQRVDDPSVGQHVEVHASFAAEGLTPGTIVRVQRETANGVLYSELSSPASWAGREIIDRNLFTWTVPPTDAWVKVTLDPRGVVAESLEDDNSFTLSLTPQVSQANLAVPVLHSHSRAPVAVYLDFDGHYQAEFAGSTHVTTPAYDTDGNPLALSDAERAEITRIWARVAEDYSPFDVDVTTELPADGRRFQRVVIGGASCDWYQFSAAGTALAGSFSFMDEPSAAYVFTQQANGDGSASPFTVETIADAASHEAAHAFGLMHQAKFDATGQLVNPYNPGEGEWGPIMGKSGNPVSTWYNGPTDESPTAYQDDMATLTDGRNGFGYRADDAGNDITRATSLGEFGSTGVIETMGDIDVYSVTLPAGTFRFAANVATDGPNLDAILELRDSSGSLVATADPSDRQWAAVELAVAAGTYYVAVRATGAYGWVGQYTLSVGAPAAAGPSIPPLPAPPVAAGPAPDLAASLTTKPPKSVVTGTKSSTTVAVSNVGVLDSSGPVTVKVYASRDRDLSSGGVLLGKAVLRSEVERGEHKGLNVRIAYPKSMGAGKYYLVATVEGTGAEKSAENNVAASGATVKVVAPASKLTGTVVPPKATLSNRRWTAAVSVKNEGNSTFSGKAIVRLVASKDRIFGNDDDVLIGTASASVKLAPGASRGVLVRATGAATSGTYNLFASVTRADGVTAAARKAVKVRFV